MGTSFELELPRDPGAARLARRVVAERLGPDLDREQIDRARLIVSELVNNAVLHGRGAITLRAELDPRRLRVDVIDEGSGFERRVRESGFDQFGGHGLQIVDLESTRWGMFEGTTHVWFELERDAPRRYTTGA